MKKGFTIIELIVVVAIVGILSAVTLSIIGNTGIQAPASIASAVYPEPSNYVVDSAGVFDAPTKVKLVEKLKALDSKAQIAVVTVKTTQPLSIEEYSIKLAEKWKVGYAGQDNGIIFLVATEDRKMRIEVGRGFEGQLNDAKAGTILRDVVTPYFKSGDWNGGVIAGTEAIINVIK